MHFGIDAQCHERADIQVDDVGRGRLEYDLVLVIMLQAVGVLAVATVFGAARWLNVGGTPWLGADRAQEGGCMRGRSEEHTSELQSLMRISYAVFCLKKNNTNQEHRHYP